MRRSPHCIRRFSITRDRRPGVSNPVREDQATKDETSPSAENPETKLAATEGDHDERAKLHMRWAICPFIEHLSGKTREIGRDIGFVYD